MDQQYIMKQQVSQQQNAYQYQQEQLLNQQLPAQQIIYTQSPIKRDFDSVQNLQQQVQLQQQQQIQVVNGVSQVQIPQQQNVIYQQNQIQQQNQQSSPFYFVPTVPAIIEPDQMNCILPPSDEQGGLYLGGLDAALDLELLKKYKIRAVLTTSIETPITYQTDSIQFHECLDAHDKEFFDITQVFEKAIQFIDRNRKYTSVLVHCYAGVSRSASCVIAYLMTVYKWPLEKCLWFCRQKRRFVRPNPGFMKKLIEYEKEIFGFTSLSKKSQAQLTAGANQQQIVYQNNPSFVQPLAQKNIIVDQNGQNQEVIYTPQQVQNIPQQPQIIQQIPQYSISAQQPQQQQVILQQPIQQITPQTAAQVPKNYQNPNFVNNNQQILNPVKYNQQQQQITPQGGISLTNPIQQQQKNQIPNQQIPQQQIQSQIYPQPQQMYSNYSTYNPQ